MTRPKYKELAAVEKIQAGDEFSWKRHFDDTEDDWYPVETFVGRRVGDIQKRSNVTFRRPIETP
jgi:hypothetical protein